MADSMLAVEGAAAAEEEEVRADACLGPAGSWLKAAASRGAE